MNATRSRTLSTRRLALILNGMMSRWASESCAAVAFANGLARVPFGSYITQAYYGLALASEANLWDFLNPGQGASAATEEDMDRNFRDTSHDEPPDLSQLSDTPLAPGHVDFLVTECALGEGTAKLVTWADANDIVARCAASSLLRLKSRLITQNLNLPGPKFRRWLAYKQARKNMGRTVAIALAAIRANLYPQKARPRGVQKIVTRREPIVTGKLENGVRVVMFSGRPGTWRPPGRPRKYVTQEQKRAAWRRASRKYYDRKHSKHRWRWRNRRANPAPPSFNDRRGHGQASKPPVRRPDDETWQERAAELGREFLEEVAQKGVETALEALFRR